MTDINVAGGWTDPSLERSVFGGEPVHHRIALGERLPDILAKYGFFKSKGEAKRNGWDKDIPPGYSEWKIGKMKRQLTVWNPTSTFCEGERKRLRSSPCPVCGRPPNV